jgi:hypothetical protein
VHTTDTSAKAWGIGKRLGKVVELSEVPGCRGSRYRTEEHTRTTATKRIGMNKNTSTAFARSNTGPVNLLLSGAFLHIRCWLSRKRCYVRQAKAHTVWRVHAPMRHRDSPVLMLSLAMMRHKGPHAQILYPPTSAGDGSRPQTQPVWPVHGCFDSPVVTRLPALQPTSSRLIEIREH